VKKKQFGQKGEAFALAHLKKRGYTIITTNWQCPYGEIDIIARQENTLVFVEVRSRHSHSTEAAFSSIDNRKRKKLQASAYAYLSEHESEDILWRIDVIAIAIPREGAPIVEHLENALDW